MKPMLTENERLFASRLSNWDRKTRPIQSLLLNVLLFVGGGVVVAVAFYSIRNLNDQTALWITVPGLLIGVVLFVAYWLGTLLVQDRHRTATILEKLEA